MLSYAVIGHPIGHTMSPYIHRRLFVLSGITAQYDKLDIAPPALADAFEKDLSKLAGFNITIPHKQAIIPLLDGLDDSAAMYGAVNCVSIKDKAIGYNTDAYGFCTAIAKKGIPLSGKVLLLGSGGAARTVAYEAVMADCDLTIAARSDSGAKLKAEISDKLGKKVTVAPFDEIEGGYDLVVNATPVGMHPNVDASPLLPHQLDGCTALFDAIYNPRETTLIRMAREHGMVIAEGMAMLICQAVRAHEIWYGASFKDADIDALTRDANDEMAHLFGGGR